MLQRGGVAPGIRPEEVLRLFASYYDDPADPGELLARVGLVERRRSAWRHLSGGEQQRLSLALALIGRPDVVFLDEPTSGVDPTGRQVVRDVMGELRAQGVCVLVTTHDLDEAERMADHVVIIDRGRLLAEGSPTTLTTSGRGGEIRFGAPAGLDVAALAARMAAEVTEVAPGDYVVAAEATPAAVAALTAWLAERDLPLADLRAGRHSPRGRLPPPHRGGRRAGSEPGRTDPVDGADDERPRRPGPHRAAAQPAQRRAAPRRHRHPGAAAGVLLDGRRAAPPRRRQRAGRLPGPGRAGPRRHVECDGEPGDRHRVRAPVRRAQAARQHPARARALGGRQDPHGPRPARHPGGGDRRRGRRPRLVTRGAGRAGPRRRACSARWPSAESAWCWPGRCAAPSTSPSPTGSTSPCCSPEAW